MYTYYGIGLIQFHCAVRLYVFLQSDIVWTLSIWYVTLHFRDQRGAASLRYRNHSRQNHRSYVWTEALSGMVFVVAQKLSGIAWTPIWCVTVHFRDFRSVTEIAPKLPFLCVNRSRIRHGFHVGKKALRCSMDITLITGLWKRKYSLHLLIRASCFVQVINFL